MAVFNTRVGWPLEGDGGGAELDLHVSHLARLSHGVITCISNTVNLGHDCSSAVTGTPCWHAFRGPLKVRERTGVSLAESHSLLSSYSIIIHDGEQSPNIPALHCVGCQTEMLLEHSSDRPTQRPSQNGSCLRQGGRCQSFRASSILRLSLTHLLHALPTFFLDPGLTL